MRGMFRLFARPGLPYERRDRGMTLYAPISLMVLLATWLAIVITGYTLMYWGLGGLSMREAFSLSGSAVLTLGFGRPSDLPATVLVFTEAAMGLVLLALLITYLPSVVEILRRAWRTDGLSKINVLWRRAEQWFLEIQETHMSFPAVVFFRSPEPDHSWVTAGGAILDSACLLLSTVDLPRDPNAAYCIRAGYLALRRIATFFGIPFDPDPHPDDPISISRDEFDDVCEALSADGVPLVSDLDQAWRDFAGWRVNYDRVLLALAELTMAPYAPWSSDRAMIERRRPMNHPRTSSS